MKLVVCIALLLLVAGCTSGRTDNALKALGTWDIASYGAQVNMHVQIEEADFTIPQIGVPMKVKGLVLILHLHIGKYDGDKIMLKKAEPK